MAMNKNSLQAKINNMSKETGVHQNILLKSYFFDAFLRRLSASGYSDNFVFKGGFLLAMSLGIDLRSTMDIDFLLRRMDLEKQNIINTLVEVASIDLGDNVHFEFKDVSEIRADDEYGGYNIAFWAKLENIEETISIDIATGDPITPNAVDYGYKCLFDGEILTFNSYNFETIIAEKLQTVLSRGVTNSRSKDFYDLYIIHKLRWNEISLETLGKAFANTCNYRGTVFDKKDALKIIDNIKTDRAMKTRWNAYKKRNKYVGHLEFEEAVAVVAAILSNLI